MVYSVWLFGLSLLFVIVERLWPRANQPVLRRGIWTDILYLIFNGEYLGVLVGVISIHAIALLDRTGLAHHFDVTQALFEAYGDPAFAPARRARGAKQRQSKA